MSERADLDRMLRRFLAGDLQRSILTDVFAAEHARLSADLAALAPRRTELRRISRVPLETCEKNLDSAARALYGEYFVSARAALRRAAQARRDLGRALAALDDQLTATADFEALIAEHGLDALRSLPVLRIPQRLVERARHLLDQGEHSKAGFQARLARRLVVRLAARRDQGRRDLLLRIQRLATELAGTDGELAAAQARGVVDRGCVYLGTWLADDLENRLADRVIPRRLAAFRQPLASGVAKRLGKALADTEAQSAALRRSLAESARGLVRGVGGATDEPGRAGGRP
jgi:hypothetical protein